VLNMFTHDALRCVALRRLALYGKNDATKSECCVAVPHNNATITFCCVKSVVSAAALNNRILLRPVGTTYKITYTQHKNIQYPSVTRYEVNATNFIGISAVDS